MSLNERTELLGYFKYDHLPEHLQPFSKPFGELAEEMNAKLAATGSNEINAGLRKLLEAKDCFVRASLHLPKEG
jgi:hypothetical protein